MVRASLCNKHKASFRNKGGRRIEERVCECECVCVMREGRQGGGGV